MKLPAFLPGVPEVVREAIIVIAGAALAAVVIGQFPRLKQYIKDQWT